MTSGREIRSTGQLTYSAKWIFDGGSLAEEVASGSGRLRGVWGQGNEEAVKVFDQILVPFRDLGVVASRLQNTGGTDHLSFDRVGVPGFEFIQDPLEYGIRSHHSHVDTYERLVIDDLKQAATIVAWTVFTIANRDEMMPR